MPELPEVETTRRGITPHLVGRQITDVVIRDARLRWPVAADLARSLRGQIMRSIDRRAKYLLLRTDAGCLIVHLGMSGSLRVTNNEVTPAKHDHVDLVFSNSLVLRFRDPRRFGSLHWCLDPSKHPLLLDLGPEPWDEAFNAAYLHARARSRKQAVKTYLMDSRTVVGVGNIYASEVLFAAGVRPSRPAGSVSLERYARIATTVREVLQQAIVHGGTTLRDFTNGEGKPGYFRHALQVYGRAGSPCLKCGAAVRWQRLGQRSSFYCPQCQR